MEIDDPRRSSKDTKKNGDKKNKKKSEPAKPKPPKTIEEALEAVNYTNIKIFYQYCHRFTHNTYYIDFDSRNFIPQ